MSRIGRMPVVLPSGVQVSIANSVLTAKGPLGQLTTKVQPTITIEIEGNQILVGRLDDTKKNRSWHGLYRSLIANTVEGVSKGFSKQLELVGVGYRAAIKGAGVELNIGYSHPIEFKAPDGITFEVEKNTLLTVKGVDKQLVGQVAANIRKLRKPEPYKGRGIKYADEVIIRKAGKSAAK